MQALLITENSYALCQRHADRWIAGGWQGDMWPIEDDDPEYGGCECADCADAAAAE